MDQTTVVEHDAIVIGAGISGLATAKCLKDDGFDVLLLERSCEVGGLWVFRENDYGVMSFTHINVSKYNYSFSDFPFPDSTPDYPHHSDMAKYIKDYANHFKLMERVHFRVKVIQVEKTGEKWRITACKVQEDGKTEEEGSKLVYVCSHLAVSTGHHAKPTYPSFPGEDTFPGEIIHSVDYNDAASNKFEGQRVLIVGIGNSAVDAAVDCATSGRCSNVHLSTRSGAWIIPNYILGQPTDLYANRFFFLLPRSVQSWVFEKLFSLLLGSPKKWGLNPKMGILDTQPTVSPTLIHHIQRRNIRIAPNITKIEGKTVHFINGTSSDFDKILYCTGYKIDLPFLSDSVRSQILDDANNLELYKNVFSPAIGPSLAFIGFVQPASGGIISMSEMQARWFSALCRGKTSLPEPTQMQEEMKQEKRESDKRWYHSARHTIQKDPIVYCDDIANIINVKPDPLKNPLLSWRLLFSTCGTAQYRLVGPHSWSGAAKQLKKVPVPDMWKATGYSLVALCIWMMYLLFCVLCSFLGLFF